MPGRFNVAVIGAGDMGGEHVRGWTLAGHEVVAVADVDLARARALAAAHGVARVYADYQAAVADPAVDIVSICTPLVWHAPMTIDAAAQGKHVQGKEMLTVTEAIFTSIETGRVVPVSSIS